MIIEKYQINMSLLISNELLAALKAAKKRLDFAKKLGLVDTKLEETINHAINRAERG